MALAGGETRWADWFDLLLPYLVVGCAAAGLVWGIYHRERLLGLLVPTYGLALVALAGWGIYWLGFPQFSELGWL